MRGMEGQAIPPGYVEDVKRLMALIPQWIALQDKPPELRWHDAGTTMFVAALQGDALKYLADSPDAFRLLEWLDEKTGRKATLFQATIALRLLGHLPERGDLVSESAALKSLRHYAEGTGTRTHVGEQIPCPSCGENINGASGPPGHVPKPGDLGLCIFCAAALLYVEGPALRLLTEAELAELHPENRTQIEQQQALIRQSKLPRGKGKAVQA